MKAQTDDRPGFQTWEQAVASLLNDREGMALARDCYFDGTALEAGQRYWASEEWQAVRRLLPEVAGKALDVGAGHALRPRGYSAVRGCPANISIGAHRQWR